MIEICITLNLIVIDVIVVVVVVVFDVIVVVVVDVIVVVVVTLHVGRSQYPLYLSLKVLMSCPPPCNLSSHDS